MYLEVFDVHPLKSGADPGRAIEAIAHRKPYESNFIRHDFVQF